MQENETERPALEEPLGSPVKSGGDPTEHKRAYRLKMFRAEEMRAFLQKLYTDGYRARHISEFLLWYVIDFERTVPGPCAIRAVDLPRGEEPEILKKWRKDGYRPIMMLDGIAFLYKEGEPGSESHRAAPDLRPHSSKKTATGIVLLLLVFIGMLLMSLVRRQSLVNSGLLLFCVLSVVLLFGNFLLPLFSAKDRAQTLMWLKRMQARNTRGDTWADALGRSLLYAAVTTIVVCGVMYLYLTSLKQ